MIADSSLSLHCKSIFVYLWHMPCIDMVYSCHILLLSLPSHNFPVKPLHPTKELFCALQILIKALDAFILMKTRFYLEKILLGYTRYISGISKEKGYTWYIPGIYHEKTFWGFQMGGPAARRSRSDGHESRFKLISSCHGKVTVTATGPGRRLPGQAGPAPGPGPVMMMIMPA